MAALSAAPPVPLLEELVREQKQGRARGVASLCSAHPEVLRAAFEAARAAGSSALVESTCNQVNQEGGYTGVKPAGFVAFVARLAGEAGLPPSRVVLGGDHLGPNPWTRLQAAPAMDRACELVRDYVLAGYAKIHLDASMRCADDPPGALADEAAAERTARLAHAAETAAAARAPGAPALLYVIGTEVPPPGGQAEGHGGPAPTSADDARRGLSLTYAAFARLGLEHATPRILAQVVQPGVEFGDDDVFLYQREAARGLRALAEADEQLLFEAHSTDYQPEGSLRALVEDHFAILKVGPELTFAWREALFALEAVERELLARRAPGRLSGLARALDEAMRAEPRHWQAFHAGADEEQLRLRRAFSLSDRARYYWTAAPVRAAVERLFANLDGERLPRGLVGQHRLGAPHEPPPAPRPGRSAALARAHVRRVLERYARACEPSRPGPLAPEVLPL